MFALHPYICLRIGFYHHLGDKYQLIFRILFSIFYIIILKVNIFIAINENKKNHSVTLNFFFIFGKIRVGLLYIFLVVYYHNLIFKIPIKILVAKNQHRNYLFNCTYVCIIENAYKIFYPLCRFQCQRYIVNNICVSPDVELRMVCRRV